MRATRRVAFIVLGTPALVTALAVRLLAQSERHGDPARADSGALTLDRVVRIALVSSPAIRTAARQADIGEGALVQASGAFDPQLQSTLGRGHDNSLLTDPLSAAVSTSGYVTDRLTYAVGMHQQLRSGIVVTPQLTIARNSASTLPGLATSQSTAQLDVLVPLARDRVGVITRSTERAAAFQLAADSLDLRNAVARAVVDAAAAYWSYHAALARLAAYGAAESRAQRMVEHMRTLVAADERTAADLKQSLAYLSSKTVARIASEQAVVEARAQLALTVGLRTDAAHPLPVTATPFPEPAASRDSMLATPSESIVRGALRRRDDLAAASRRVAGADVQLGAARDATHPRVDVDIGLGYTGVEYGYGVDHFLAPIYRHIPGLSASVELRYTRQTTNADARGALVQSTALAEQQRIARDDVVRRVESGVAVAFASLRASALALASASEGVTLSREAVQNEERKFALGASTVFDIVQAQDALTNAELDQIAQQQAYANAIVSARYETATLVPEHGGWMPNASSLLDPPPSAP